MSLLCPVRWTWLDELRTFETALVDLPRASFLHEREQSVLNETPQ